MHAEESDIRYIDLAEDEIAHFKYIRRVRTADGWRYYYDEESANNDRIAAKKKINEADSKAFKASQKYYRATNIYKEAGINANGKVQRQYNRAARQYKRAERKARNLVKKYNNLVVRQNMSKKISAGIIKIANMLSNISGKKKK
jgi:triphosphoribosyl-dephospho-CoA synthetase